jgi:glucosyl-dolichyl phosphate glucuronosyltransferase
MKCTVAICTWNRATLLARTLAEMQRLQVPVGLEWELLVVNNNCGDDTERVLEQFQNVLPLRRLFEAKPGQCHARNCAIDAARGDLIIWTDDDVLVSRDWLSAYVSAYLACPQAGFFGGPVSPWFEGKPPRWLVRAWPVVSSAFAVRDLGESPVDIWEAQQLPYGANFAVVTKLQREFTYDPRIGLRPGSEVRGDEVDVLRKLLAAGVHGKWIPTASVRHFIPRSRQRAQYLRKYFFGVGQTVALLETHAPSPTIFGRPRWLLRQVFESELRFQITRFTSPSEVWLRHLARASECWGQLSTMKNVPSICH